MIKRVYVWEFPVRFTHWVNFLAIIVLAVTGLYVGSPYFYALSESQFLMSKMRFWHMIAAYFLIASFLLRMYWMFMGNRYSRWNQFIPVSGERIQNTFGTAAYYCFLKEKCPDVVGHTGMAGLTYAFIFFLIFFEIVSGFALYSELRHGLLWGVLGGWLLHIMNAGTVRLLHHLVMYAIGIFVVIHVYISWHNDLAERSGLTSSIFSGYKSLHE